MPSAMLAAGAGATAIARDRAAIQLTSRAVCDGYDDDGAATALGVGVRDT